MQTETIVALATPPGKGAIAVLRISGPEAIAIVDGIFQGKNLSKQAGHTAHFGKITDADGIILDEALATIFRGPRSYTGEDTVELSLHGSPFIQQRVMELLLRQNARLARAGEFTLRAFLNGKMDLSQAEAVADLIASENAAAHQVAMHQLRGGFRREIAELRGELVHFAGMVELELDFSEEDVEFADRAQLAALVRRIQGLISKLLGSFTLGNAVKNGISAVIAGRPNAGKSTLLNALLNEDRAIVSNIAGTTRDTIEEMLTIKGLQFRITDTAGLREAQDAIEAIGVQRSLEKIRQAALLVYVWDISGGMTPADVHRDLKSLLTRADASDAPPFLVVCNKMDTKPDFDPDWLLSPNDAAVLVHFPPGEPLAEADILTLNPAQIVTISAEKGENVEVLKDSFLESALGNEVHLESTVVTNARHYEALQKSDASLRSVLHGLESGVTGDFVAQDIRHALYHLGTITGQIGVEDVLDHIFANFCIGK